MKSGAFDYLMKPCDIDRLLAKIKLAARQKRDHLEEIYEAEAQWVARKQGLS